MSSGGSKTQKQTTTTEPYKPSQPGLNQSIKDATSLYKAGGLRIDYPTTTVAPVAPEMEQAWQMTADRAQNNPLLGQSQDYLSDVLSGKYLNAEAPGFQDVLARTRDMVNANASAGSRYGSGVHDAALARELGGLEYQNYARERGIQDAAAGLAPQVAAQDYFDLAKLGEVGQQRRGVMQEFVSDEAARQQWEQQAAANEIALYQSLLGGNFGGTSTAYVPTQQQNPWLLGLGAATSLGGGLLGNPGLF
jgi:hypothetical protein